MSDFGADIFPHDEEPKVSREKPAPPPPAAPPREPRGESIPASREIRSRPADEEPDLLFEEAPPRRPEPPPARPAARPAPPEPDEWPPRGGHGRDEGGPRRGREERPRERWERERGGRSFEAREDRPREDRPREERGPRHGGRGPAPHREGREPREPGGPERHAGRSLVVHRPPEAAAPGAPEPAGTTATATQRVALLVDLGWLRAEARQAGGELSQRRLAKALGGNRALIRAIAYASAEHAKFGGSLNAHGFELETLDDDAAAPVAIAVDALALATRVDAIVIAAPPRPLAPLLRALRAQGIRVDLAGFQAAPAAAGVVQIQLGRDCLFVP
jgi:hypothetical protein